MRGGPFVLSAEQVRRAAQVAQEIFCCSVTSVTFGQVALGLRLSRTGWVGLTANFSPQGEGEMIKTADIQEQLATVRSALQPATSEAKLSQVWDRDPETGKPVARWVLTAEMKRERSFPIAA